MTIIAQFRSSCSACTSPILPGQAIDWAKGTKPRHTGCQAPVVQPTPQAAASKLIPMGTHYVAVDDDKIAGTLLGWSGEGQVTRQALVATFQAAGLPEAWLPQAPELAKVLTRALGRARHGNTGRLQVRPVERGEEWAIVRETRIPVEPGAKRFTNSYKTLVQAVVNKTPEFAGCEVTFTLTAEDEELGWLQTAIRADFVQSRDNLATTDVSSWVADTLRIRFNGVQLLRGQRQYFVPAEHAEAARAFIAAVMAATRYEFSDVPAMRAETAIKAFLAALERETKAAAEAIQVELAKKCAEMVAAEGKEGMNRRVTTMTKRLQAVSAINTKVMAYAEMFGRPAEEAATQVERLRRNLLVSLQYAEGRAEGRDMDAPRLLDLADAPEGPAADPTTYGAEERFRQLDLD